MTLQMTSLSELGTTLFTVVSYSFVNFVDMSLETLFGFGFDLTLIAGINSIRISVIYSFMVFQITVRCEVFPTGIAKN